MLLILISLIHFHGRTQTLMPPLKFFEQKFSIKLETNILFQHIDKVCRTDQGINCHIISEEEPIVQDIQMKLMRDYYYETIEYLAENQEEDYEKNFIFYENIIRELVDQSLFYATEENKIPTKFLYDFNFIHITNQSQPFTDNFVMDADFKYFSTNVSFDELNRGMTQVNFTNFFIPDAMEQKIFNEIQTKWNQEKKINMKLHQYIPDQGYLFTKNETGEITFSNEVCLIQMYIRSNNQKITTPMKFQVQLYQNNTLVQTLHFNHTYKMNIWILSPYVKRVNFTKIVVPPNSQIDSLIIESYKSELTPKKQIFAFYQELKKVHDEIHKKDNIYSIEEKAINKNEQKDNMKISEKNSNINNLQELMDEISQIDESSLQILQKYFNLIQKLLKSTNKELTQLTWTYIDNFILELNENFQPDEVQILVEIFEYINNYDLSEEEFLQFIEMIQNESFQEN